MTPRPDPGGERPGLDGVAAVALVVAAWPAGLLWAALTGLARAAGESIPSATLLGAVLALGPATLVLLAARPSRRLRQGALALGLSSVVGLLVLPRLVPGARHEAILGGLDAVLGEVDRQGPLAQAVRDGLPEEPPPMAQAVSEASDALPPPPPVGQNTIVLPYEGEGRRLVVPVVFEHQGRTVETFMMLDTGATYTTLPSALLGLLGARPERDAPRLMLTTANGERNAEVTLVDTVWLGDLAVPGVAITPCEDCAGEGASGLLGLNVASGFNVSIDADRREVSFQRRARFDRHLDIRPFVGLDARFMRYPDDRVQVTLDLDNRAPYAIGRAVTRVACEDEAWRIVSGPVAPRAVDSLTRRLPDHERCERYRIELEQADWAPRGEGVEVLTDR